MGLGSFGTVAFGWIGVDVGAGAGMGGSALSAMGGGGTMGGGAAMGVGGARRVCRS